MGNAMMKAFFRLTWTTFFLLASAGAQADLQEAQNAYKSKNYALAQRLLEPLVIKGDAVAEYLAALMFDNGEGVPQNHPQALNWYLKAAQQGYAPAQCNLGLLYERGTGIKLSDKEAAFWYKKAAEQGNAAAQYNLGLMYYYGRGFEIRRNYKEAASWFLMAAEQGYPNAQNTLGKMYENGQSVQLSLVQAHKWYDLAAGAGSEDALNNEEALERRMDPDLIATAQALALEWLEKHK